MPADAACAPANLDDLVPASRAPSGGVRTPGVDGTQPLGELHELPLRSEPTLRWGRRRECGVFAGLLDGVRAGRSGALVVHGEPGVGKTALLEYAIGSASDLRVARAVGVQ